MESNETNIERFCPEIVWNYWGMTQGSFQKKPNAVYKMWYLDFDFWQFNIAVMIEQFQSI